MKVYKKCSMKAYIKIISVLCTLNVLASCGGGASEPAPVTSALTPQSVSDKVTVSTSLSPGGHISASQAVINKGDTAEFTLTPNNNYSIDSVSGCNGKLSNSTYVTGVVSANCTVSVSFLYVNQLPTINTIATQNVDEFSTVTLQVDANDIDGAIVSYMWTQTSGVGVSIVDASSANASFSIPPILENETLTFLITVTDDVGAQVSSTAIVIVQHTNLSPTVSLQDDVTVAENSTVVLNANASDIDGEIVSYAWTQTEGEVLVTSGKDTSLLSIEIADISEQKQAVFQVLVTDANGATAFDTITVTMINDNEAPKNVLLVGATALSPTTISVDWLETSDNGIASNKITYSVHVSEQVDFLPTTSNNKLRLIAQATANIGGLFANTVYYVIISAQDADNNISYSNELSVTTMATEPAVNASQVFKNIENVVVSQNTLTYTLSDDDIAPQVGEIIVSSSQNGILRRVTGVTVTGNIVEVTTQPAALNELYDDVDINTTIKLIDIPQANALPANINHTMQLKNLALSENSLTSGDSQRTLRGQDSQLMLSQYARALVPSRGTLSNQANSDETLQFSQEVKDKHLLLQGPTRVAFMPNKRNTLEISASVINDPTNKLEVFELALVKVSHNRIAPVDANYNVSSQDITLGNETTRKDLQLIWQPLQRDVDSKTEQPYIATFKAKVREKNCSVSCTQSTATLHVKIHVGDTEIRPKSLLAFEKLDEITIKGKGQYDFEPTINVAAKIEGGVLTNARATVKGFLDFQISLEVIADAPGGVNGSTEFVRKSFAKEMVVGGAPVIIHGDFILSGEYSAQAQGQLSIEQFLDVGYYFEAGFEYKDGIWGRVYTGTPELSYRLNGGAKSEAYAEFKLVPEIKLRFYELDGGHIKVEPSVYAEVGVESEFTGFLDVESSDETPYRFTTLAAGIGTNLKLSASFDAFDKSLLAWPEQDLNSLINVEVLEKSQLYGIPSITLQDQPTVSTLHSCVIAAVSQIAPSIPIFGEQSTFNNWESDSAGWTVSTPTFASETTDNVSVINQALSSSGQTAATTFAKYRLRFSGYSEIGAWAKQYQDIYFDFRDTNNDLLPDYWANRYGVTSANIDTDNDGINNADEFKYCTFPNIPDSDSDGMPDGWEVANSLDPVLDDANKDTDNDARTNLQEFLDNSNPQLQDINQPPTVTAGQNQSVDELSLVTLLGSAQDGGTIDSVLWLQTSGPLTGLIGNDGLATTFTAPAVNETTVLTFEFAATDNSAAASSAQVEITVNPVNAKPTAVAGTDIQLSSGELVSLDASSSFDTDGNIVAYEWTVLNGQTLNIADFEALITSFIAPEVVSTTTFEILLGVVDNQGASDTSVIKITVNPNADIPALTSIALSQLSDTVVVIRQINADNLHTTFAMLFADNEIVQSARVYISTQYINDVSGEINSNITQAPLSWSVQNNTLFIESEAFTPSTITFSDGKIDVNESISTLGHTLGEGATVAELYKRKSLITDDLKGYRFTVLENDKNTFIDFVNDTRAFIYKQGSFDIESVNWAYTNNEDGKQLQLDLHPDAPSINKHDSFNTWDTIADFLIVNISVLPVIDKPLSEVVFADSNLNACVQNSAQINNWLSVNDITSLDCSSLNIISAQGIERLTALDSLNLSGNALVNINLSPLSELRELHVNNNQLNSIDFTNNPLLAVAKLSNNNLSNATIAYLSSIFWIDDLRFDDTIVLPTGSDFVLLVTVDSLQEFKISTHPSFEYDFSVDWGDGTITSNHTQDALYTYAEAGVYEVKISGTYPALKFCDDNNGCSSIRIDLLQWGSNEWLSMQGAFSGLAKFNILATDSPDLRLVENLSFMFYKATNFNSDISNWDISSATDMNFMFGFAASFNGDISQWNTSAVTNMGGMFYFASSFNGDISQWNTGAVTKMHSLFAFATGFNTDISAWNTSSVTYMATMFLGASNFNGNVSLWDISAVDNMNKMFFDATSMTGNLSTWAVGTGVRHKDFTHAGSLLVEPNWRD
jgi:surface protein